MKRDLDLSLYEAQAQAQAQAAEWAAFAAGAVVAPELDLLASVPVPAKAQTRVASDAERVRLAALRDEFVQISSQGRFVDAASREWRQLPISWRMSMLMMSGVGQDVDELRTLAQRGWHEMQPHEQAEMRSVVRGAKKHLLCLKALAARV